VKEAVHLRHRSANEKVPPTSISAPCSVGTLHQFQRFTVSNTVGTALGNDLKHVKAGEALIIRLTAMLYGEVGHRSGVPACTSPTPRREADHPDKTVTARKKQQVPAARRLVDEKKTMKRNIR
jgi:hypothetical protein